jgi:acetyl/propionyl-CoA carboxylase alpha subunit
LAKLSVWGETRERAVGRLGRALEEYTIEGVRTTLEFFRELIRDPGFRRGELDTGFIDRFLEEPAGGSETNGDGALSDLAAVAAALHLASQTASQVSASGIERPAEKISRWKYTGRR